MSISWQSWGSQALPDGLVQVSNAVFITALICVTVIFCVLCILKVNRDL